MLYREMVALIRRSNYCSLVVFETVAGDKEKMVLVVVVAVYLVTLIFGDEYK
jgi:hypothetical protein